MCKIFQYQNRNVIEIFYSTHIIAFIDTFIRTCLENFNKNMSNIFANYNSGMV